MAFQLSRARLLVLTGVTYASFLVGLVCLAVSWLVNEHLWGLTGIGVLLIAVALNQRLLAGQLQRRTTQVVAGLTDPATRAAAEAAEARAGERASAVVPEPRAPDDGAEIETDQADSSGPSSGRAEG